MENKTTIIVTGSRDWTDAISIRKVLAALIIEFGYFTLVHGNAKGADKIAAFQYKALGGTDIIPMDAEWKKYGKAAGMIRNREMLDRHPDADLLVAFPLESSIGTCGMIIEAKRRGLTVRIYDRFGNYQ